MCAYTYMLEYVVYGFSHEDPPHADWPWSFTSVLWPGREAMAYVKEISVEVFPSRCPKSDNLSPQKT